MFHRNQGIRDDAESMNQAAAAAVTGPRMFRIAHVASAFKSAEQQRPERSRPFSDCSGAAVGGGLHERQNIIQFLEKGVFEVAVHRLQRIITEFRSGKTDLASGQQGTTVIQHQFQNFGEVQPAVGGVAVFLAHDQRLLTARNRPVRNILFGDSFGFQYLEHHVVIEQRRRGVSRGEVETSHIAEQALRRIPVNLHRQRRLRLVGTEEGFKNHIGHSVAEVVASGIASAEQQIL